MRVAVVGSRVFSDGKMFTQYMERYLEKDDEMVTGDAGGVDAFARKYAEEHKMVLHVFPARWEQYGIKAGPIRNQQIVDASDKMIAFWDGTSRGTANAIDCARRKGIHLVVARV